MELLGKPTGKGYDKWRGYKFYLQGVVYWDFLYDKTEQEVLQIANERLKQVDV